ncbi:hypothetical protein NMG60_11012863 [Bertholletia excelsa]
MKTKVGERFSDFYEKWVSQLEGDRELLLRALRGDDKGSECEALVAKLTAHHKDYYKVKWAFAHEDVLAFFVMAWHSPLEQAYLWVTGWKPSMAFRLVDSLRRAAGASLTGMTEEQIGKVGELRGKIKLEEERVEREMERLQVSMADRQMVELARLATRVKDGGSAAAQVDGLMDAAWKSLMGGLERVMKMADCVRLKTLKGLLELLNPVQCVEFLAGMGTVQVQIRRWAKHQ